MTTYRAHIFKRFAARGDREEVRLKLFDAENEVISIAPGGIPSAVYTALVLNVDNEASGDTPILWSAAPTYDPATFNLDEDRNIQFARSGIYHVVVFGELPSGMPVDEGWALRLGSMSGFVDHSWWAHATFEGLENDGASKTRPSMHLEVICSCLGPASLPVKFDSDANSPITNTHLKAFPRRLGDAIDFGGDNWIPYYLPVEE